MLQDQASFERLLEDGSAGLAVAISYAVQPSPDGLAQGPDGARALRTHAR